MLVSRETEDVEDLREVCPKGAQKIRKKDVVMTAGRWSSWSIQITQFLMLWWPAMKAGSTAMTKRQSSQWKHAGSRRPKKARQSKSTHKLLMIFFTALAWSTCTGFPLNKESTRNTMLSFFKGVREEILSEEASTLQIGSVAFPPGQYTSP